MSRLRIIVADGNPPTLRNLASLLAAECDVVASAADVASLLALVRQHKPDMVVVDIRTQKLGGVEVASALAKYPEPPPVLICAVETDPKIMEAARRAGARPYVFNTRIEM